MRRVTMLSKNDALDTAREPRRRELDRAAGEQARRRGGRRAHARVER
jgi:hypothetical protein